MRTKKIVSFCVVMMFLLIGFSPISTLAEDTGGKYEKVVIEKYVNGGNWIEFKLKNQNLDEGDKYFIECSIKGVKDYSFVEVEQPEILSGDGLVSVILGPVEFTTEYECYGAISDLKKDVFYMVPKTDSIDIITLSSKESSESGLTPSSVIEYDGTYPVNVSPLPFSLIDATKETVLKWEGPGKSDYPFSQYTICFQPGPCFNAGNQKEIIMTEKLWFGIDQGIKKISSQNYAEGERIDIEWHVKSWFRDGTKDGEQLLSSKKWSISYNNVFKGDEYDVNEIDWDLGKKEETNAATYSKVEILKFEAGVNSIILEINNQNLSKGLKYYAECVNQEKKEESYGDLRIVRLEQPEINSNIPITVGPLFENTKYGCYAAIMIPDEDAAGAYHVTSHSDWIYTSTLNEEKGEKIEFTVPPAGYEDEVLTAVELYKNPFPDTEMNELSGKAAAELYRRAVLGGYPDGEFKGYRSVNRAEAAKFLLLARYKEVEKLNNNGQFPDILDGQWYTKFVVKAAQLGIIAGHPDGMFKPADGVNTAEFLKMLSLTFGIQENMEYDYLDVDSSYWFAKYAGIAQKYNLFPDRKKYLEPGKYLTRDDVAMAIYQYLINRKK